MPQVISFEDYTPTARYDSIPWTDAQIEESVSASGPWTTIDTLPLTPVDTDPENPQVRNLTTELASDTPGLWYRIVFLDGTGDSSQPTTPVLNSASTVQEAALGPCTPWISGEDVAATCDALEATDAASYDDVAVIAYQALWELSGRQFSGECGPITVRPCEPNCVCWPDPCGCCYLSEIRLAGYPIREITEVKIDGAVVDPGEYRVDRRRLLVRLADTDGNRQRWPACQRLDLADTEDNTFSVTYTFGQDVPLLGQQAATELACQLAALTPEGSGECDLPDGVTSVTRQGMTINLERFAEEGVSALPLVSLFLQTYNRAGLRRRPAIFSPDLPAFARRVG